MRILCVDDLPDDRKDLADRLRAEGHSVLEAADGKEALWVLNLEPVDAIVSDVLMPQMDGYSLCSAVRADARFRDVPFLFHAPPYLNSEEEKHCMDLGADGCLRKPVPVRALTATLARAARKENRSIADASSESSAAIMKSYSEPLVLLLEERNRDLSWTCDQLRRSEERLALLERSIDGMLEGIQVIDSDWRYCYLNEAAARHGLSTVEALLGRTMMECYPGIEDTPFFQVMQTVMQSREAQQLENEFRFPDGRTGWFSLSVEPNPSGILIRSVDVTETHLAREAADRYRDELECLNIDLEERVAERTRELEACNRELESFVHYVTHDLRGPLRSMQGFTGVLLEDHGEGMTPEARALTERVSRNTAHMRELVESLLAFAKVPPTGALPASRVNVAELVSRVLEHFVDREGVEVRVDSLQDCLCDSVLLGQVWHNLIDNAFKFRKEGVDSRIEIGCVPRESDVTYFVRDNGVGFKQDNADRLFGMFQRLHSRAQFEGNGVGLAICRRILERFGGTIRAEAAPGNGAAFYFTLPAAVT